MKMQMEPSSLLTLHIAPNGSDQWSGLFAEPLPSGTDGPLASFAQARDCLRVLRRAENVTGPMEVVVHAGTYQIPETLYFSLDDLGNSSTPITYRAAKGDTVYLKGSRILTGFTPHEGPIWQLDLAAAGYSGLRFKQLFCNGIRQRPARYPKFDPTDPHGGTWLSVAGPEVDIYEDGHGQKDRFICHDKRLCQWSNIEDVELFIFPRYNWTNAIHRLKTYDPETGEVLLQEQAIYEIYPGDRFYFQNIREELSAPGEWYLDKQHDILYFYPPISIAQATITVSVVENLIVAQGPMPSRENLFAEKIDWADQGGDLHRVQDIFKLQQGHLTFEGFTIEEVDGAGIVLRNIRRGIVQGCTIQNTGGVGIIVLKGAECCVNDCDIAYTGSHGIYISGGVRAPFEEIEIPGQHICFNNYIHHTGTFMKSAAGISINGVGITISHNLIHDGPRWGIISRGVANRIEYNHIRHVNIETSDTAAIYLVDRDLTMHGTIIQYNRIHDILGYHCVDGVWQFPAFAFGIYLDDWTSSVIVRGNLIYRTPGGSIYIHAGQNNIVENNMFLDAEREGAFFRRWEATREQRHLGTYNQGLRRNQFRKNILTTTNATSHLYRFANVHTPDGLLDIETNIWEKNLLWNGGRPLFIEVNHAGKAGPLSMEAWMRQGFDQRSILADPKFVNQEREDFRLQEQSPAYTLGFDPLPLELMGLLPSVWRAHYPVREVEGIREGTVDRSTKVDYWR